MQSRESGQDNSHFQQGGEILMKNQVNGNGKINNSQRSILAKLAVEVLDKKIQQGAPRGAECNA